jgi:hypothetical protein
MGADLDTQLQRWRVASVLREKLPGVSASVVASAIWQAIASGEARSHDELVEQCFAIIENRKKGMNKVVKVLDGFRIPPGSVYVGRDKRYGDPKWGNPYHIGKDGAREEVIAKYRAYVLSDRALMRDLHELRGKDLSVPLRSAAVPRKRPAGDFTK